MGNAAKPQYQQLNRAKSKRLKKCSSTASHCFEQGGMSDSDEEAVSAPLDLFQEPADFYRPEQPATFTTYTLQNGQTLNLRLVGHSPLWV